MLLKPAYSGGNGRLRRGVRDENCHFSRQIRHFPACTRVPAPFNLHLHNARTEVRCTVSRSLFCTLMSGGFRTMAKASTKPPSKTEIFASIAETTGLTKR